MDTDLLMNEVLLNFFDLVENFNLKKGINIPWFGEARFNKDRHNWALLDIHTAHKSYVQFQRYGLSDFIPIMMQRATNTFLMVDFKNVRKYGVNSVFIFNVKSWEIIYPLSVSLVGFFVELIDKIVSHAFIIKGGKLSWF